MTAIAVAAPAAAFADSPSGSTSAGTQLQPNTVVINGREFGPEDGLQVDTLQLDVDSGSGTVGVVIGSSASNGSGTVAPMDAWGASYAISTETAQIRFDGKAKAAANIYLGKRIIQVCIWYTRGGTHEGDKVCSTATDPNDVWRSGPEVTTWCWDSLNPLDPHTIFNIQTWRIDPRIL